MPQHNDRLRHPDITPVHRLPIQTRFGDYDAFGHINNNAYMAFFDLGKAEFFSFALGRRAMPNDLSAVIVNINVDFLAPALPAESLEVQSMVEHLGDRSFTVYQRVVNPVTGSVKAQATTVLAGFDLATQSSGLLNPVLTEALRSTM